MSQTVCGEIHGYWGDNFLGVIERNNKRYVFLHDNIEDLQAAGEPADGQIVTFEEAAGENGPQALHITRAPSSTSALKYALEPGFHVCRKSFGAQPLELLAVSDWSISVEGAGRAADVEEQLIEKVKAVGANGILKHPEHEILESEDSDSRIAVHRFTCHPCLLGRVSASGLTKAELPDLNAVLRQEAEKTAEKSERDTRLLTLLFFLITIPLLGASLYIGSTDVTLGILVLAAVFYFGLRCNRNKTLVDIRYAPLKPEEKFLRLKRRRIEFLRKTA
jgi:cold shock CspA family protein